jgi:predicted DNA-binding protein (MmcQ/YjbR family)
MNIEAFRRYCLKKPGVTEEFPFDETVLVFKVGGKIFALTDVDTFESINLKCDPERALELRERYDFVQPGYHMNKKHWNTILITGAVPDSFLQGEIDASYALVAAKLPKSEKLRLGIK